MRQVIYVNEIMVFFDKKERQSYKMMAEIIKCYNKKEFKLVTIIDFLSYYNISQESIIEVMKSNDQLKNQQFEAIKKEKTEEAAIQKRLKEAKEQQILQKIRKDRK